MRRYEQVQPFQPSVGNRFAWFALAVLGFLSTCLVYKLNSEHSLLHWPRLRGHNTMLLTNFFADSPSPFGIVGHPSVEDKAARAMAKQQTKKEEIMMEFKPLKISGPTNFAQETEVGSPNTASIGSGTTFASVYNARPVFSGHLDEDEKIARAMVKQETKKESNVQLTFTNGQFADMANKIEAFEFMNLNLENFAQLPLKDEDEASAEGELNRSEFISTLDEVPHENPLEDAPPNSADSTLPSSTITTELSQDIDNNDENASTSMESPNTVNEYILTTEIKAENADGSLSSSYPEDSPFSSSILTELSQEIESETSEESMKSPDPVESPLKNSNYFLVPETEGNNQSVYLTSSIPEDSSVLSSVLTTERSQENETEENASAYVESPNLVQSLPSTLILGAETNEGNAVPSTDPADFTSSSSILTTAAELSQETETSEENASTSFEFSNPPTETPSLILPTSTNEENAVPSPDPMDSPFSSSLLTTELITELSQETETYEESVSVSLESLKPMFIESPLTKDTELSQETETDKENASTSMDDTKDDNAVSSFDTMDFLLPKLSQETETYEGDAMETPNLVSTDPFPNFMLTTESNDENAAESPDRMDFSLPSIVVNTELSQDTESYEESVSASLESPNPMSIESPEPMDSALPSSIPAELSQQTETYKENASGSLKAENAAPSLDMTDFPLPSSIPAELSQETETYEENASASMKEENAAPSLDTIDFPLPSSIPTELSQETETYEGDAGATMESPNLVSTDPFPNVLLPAEPNEQNAEESPFGNSLSVLDLAPRDPLTSTLSNQPDSL